MKVEKMPKKKKLGYDDDRGPTWEGLYPRVTKTKREKVIQEQRKAKNRRRSRGEEDYD